MGIEPCHHCGSKNVKETPTKVELDDGTIEVNHDTLNARCLDCEKEWIIVYY